MSDAEARRRIEEDLDATFVVEAAAGTGKTTSLVRRVLATVGSGVDIGRIVAVTFTDKAAGELRFRIRAGLEQKKIDARGDAKRAYANALGRLEEAHISTIHRFAGDLLRSRPVEAGIDPLFSALSPGESRALFDEAFGAWLEQTRAHPSAALRRALARSDGSAEQLRFGARRLMEHRHLDTPWTTRPVDVEQEARALVPAITALADRSARARSKTDKLFVALTPFRDAARRIARESSTAERLEAELVSLATGPFGDRFGSGFYGAGVDRAELLAEMTALRAALARFAERASAHLAVELRDDLLGAVRMYDTLKSRRGTLDFDDLLLRARDVLRTDDILRRDVKGSLTHFFVDEFQDTDPVQAQLLLLLASEDAQDVSDPFSARIAPGRLFVVGDPKQSIYRFRHADPGTYELVRKRVVESGGEILELGQSFRSVPSILRFVNAAFEEAMQHDERSQQPHYVALQPSRTAEDVEPAVIALPVTHCYGKRRLSRISIRTFYPQTIAAFIAWLLDESGRTVIDPATKERVPIAARHVAILFRQFAGARTGPSGTERLAQELTKHGVPHVVLGGSSLGGREEAHAIATALRAIEVPDDALVVYATLRGLLFGLTDEVLFEWSETFGSVRATHLPKPEELASGDDADKAARLQTVLEALGIIDELHRRRNARPVGETLAALLSATRAHVGFGLSPSAEQAFLQIAAIEQIAASHERNGGLSFASFIDALDALENERMSAAEESIDDERGGVRIMTVHRAKGLEFPVVLLADPAEGSARAPDKFVDVGRNLGVLSLAGCAPWDLLEARETELARATAEGARLAYVAATRAADLLIVPVVGDDPTFPPDGWLTPIARALTTPSPITGPDLVRNRPDEVERPTRSLAAGVHTTLGGPVLFFDPNDLGGPPKSALGVRAVELVSKDADPSQVAADLAEWERAEASRRAAIEAGGRPARRIETVTKRAKASALVEAPERDVEVLAVGRATGRPGGKRFGNLVHLVLATVSLDADATEIGSVARSVGRLLGAEEGEPEAAALAVGAALAHAMFDRARASQNVRREVPVTISQSERDMVDGIVDLAFEESGMVVVVDYKTDDPSLLRPEHLVAYRTQVDLYARAIERATGKPVHAALLFV